MIDTTVDLTEVILGVIAVVIPIGMAYIGPALKDALNVTIERKHELALQAALAAGAKAAVKGLQERGALSIEVKNEAVRDAARYAIEHVPDAVAYFNKSETALREMAVSRVADVESDKTS